MSLNYNKPQIIGMNNHSHRSNNQYLDVRNRNLTLNDVNINKELPLSPPNADVLQMNMDDDVDEIQIENEGAEGNESDNDSDLFIEQETTPQGPPQPPPVPQHTIDNYVD